jgi:hypothetical protein
MAWYVDSNASTVWAASTAYSTGARVSHATYPNRIYECTTGGTSGSTVTPFEQTDGATTSDGTVTWTTRLFSSSWSNAAPSLFAVSGNTLTNGDTILVEYRHAYAPTTSQTATFAVLDLNIISVDKDASDVFRAGASELSTTAGVTPRYDFFMTCFIRGLSLGSNASSGNGGVNITVPTSGATGADYYGNFWYEDCIFRNTGTGTIQISAGYYGGFCTFVKCQFINGTYTSQSYSVLLNGVVVWRFYNCTFSHPADSDTDWRLFLGSQSGARYLIEDSDLSAFQAISLSNRPLRAEVRRCKIKTGLIAVDDTNKAENIASSLVCYDCFTVDDIAQTNSRMTRYVCGFGTVVYEDDTVYRNAYDGESYHSLKMTPDATWSNKYRPVDIPTPLAIWHDASGSKTLKVFLASDDFGLLDDEVWIHVTHVSADATTPAMGTFITTRGTGAAAGTSTYLKTGTIGEWNGSGPSTAYEFQITSIDPEEPGYIYVRVFYGYTGAYSVWVDPAITLT